MAAFVALATYLAFTTFTVGVLGVSAAIAAAGLTVAGYAALAYETIVAGASYAYAAVSTFLSTPVAALGGTPVGWVIVAAIVIDKITGGSISKAVSQIGSAVTDTLADAEDEVKDLLHGIGIDL